jgi:hypothetical protein
MICQWCEEPIEEPVHPSAFGTGMHPECAYRSACGSIAHLMRRCSCYVPGAEEGDPPGMTKREAALEVFEFALRLQRATQRAGVN